MAAFSALVVLALFARALALPSYSTETSDNPPQRGVLMTEPPRPTYIGLKKIPDEDHPYMPPGPNDQRGPCPGLNTLANHGYISRNGIVTYEEMVTGSVEAYNFDYDLVAAISASGMMARGNPFINKMSIGLQVDEVPALPDYIDGPVAKGLAAHGRFEGDVSMTRDDALLGNNKDFQPHLYEELLSFMNDFGYNSTTYGPRSLVGTPVMREFKWQRFLDSQANNKGFEYPAARMATSYGEAAFVVYFFANGTDGTLTVPSMTSFFRDERFPENHYRAGVPGTFPMMGFLIQEMYTKYPVQPGANSENGTYVENGTAFDSCSLYLSFVSHNSPVAVLNTTGLLKRNVEFMIEVMHRPFPACAALLPSSAPGV